MGQTARICRAHSTALDAVQAAQDLYDGLVQPDLGLVAFFCSTSFDLEKLAAEIERRFAGVNVIGCTTAGEITPAGYMEGSITGFSIAAIDCCAVTALISEISHIQFPRGAEVVDELAAALAEFGHRADPADTFALLLIDGMGTTEEMVLAAVHRQLDPIPLMGGSAGDDMRLQKTFVYHAGRFHSDAALLSLIKIRYPFRIFRHQHYSGSNVRLVVTGADPERRIVTELNAEPAGEEYARIVGIDYRDLTPMVFAEYPLMVRVGGDYYVRSIGKINEDGSLTFFCAIDEGVVLTLGHHEDMVNSLRRFFLETAQRHGRADAGHRLRLRTAQPGG